ncbi:MAG TPA: beta-ketoacyl-[acyl-carrier-protein] synthase family protein [Candidatus Methylacidiphilales bacterium]|nr:beta-ketoacyl-[acyl-carrier-protein] synthase family protein [Candidatus Methylacidiphilales bacterium]
MKRPVVVTGVGAVTPLGENVSQSWEALAGGKEADAPLELFDTSGCRCHRAATASLPSLPSMRPKALSRLSRASRLAIPAAREALAAARLLDAEGRSLPPVLPLSVSTTAGGMAFGEDFLRNIVARRRSRLLGPVARYLPHQQILDMQQALGFEGPSVIIANACASGANAIGHAAAMVASGLADCVLTGGFEALTELVFAGFDCLQATTVERCRPFDLNRSGLLLGEGAAFLVLETPEHAKQRGVPPLCRLAGYGHDTDFFHLTQPQPAGHVLAKVMRSAAKAAGITPRDIGYVNAHGTATPVNDGTEVEAYNAFFAESFGQVRISSTKAAIGHTLGAAGSIEAFFTLMALLTGKLPPQLNLQAPIPEIAPALVTENAPLRRMNHAMSVNLGFGGSNAALVFSRDED